MLPELSSEPICESKLENDVLLDEEPSVELSRLVSES
jgi:hypothetical protein